VYLALPKFLHRQHIADGYLYSPGLGRSKESPITEPPPGFRRAFSEPDRRATQCKKKEIKNHLKLNKASDEKLILGITSVGSSGQGGNAER
jgi:hypothetical protein